MADFEIDPKDMRPDYIWSLFINKRSYIKNHKYEIESNGPHGKMTFIMSINQKDTLKVISYIPYYDKTLDMPFIKAIELSATKKHTHDKRWPTKDIIIIEPNAYGFKEIVDFLKRTKNPFLTKEWLDSYDN